MRTALFASSMLALPRAVLACPVCFGENDSPLAAAMNLGILAMLLITVGVLVSFASFFIVLMRRASLAANGAGPEAGFNQLDGRLGDGRTLNGTSTPPAGAHGGTI
jgi:hypothetical protein